MSSEKRKKAVRQQNKQNKHFSKRNHFTTFGSCSHSILDVNKVRFQMIGMSAVEENLEIERFTVVCSRRR